MRLVDVRGLRAGAVQQTGLCHDASQRERHAPYVALRGRCVGRGLSTPCPDTQTHTWLMTISLTLNHARIPPFSFLQAGCPSCHPTNSIKALKIIKVLNSKSQTYDLLPIHERTTTDRRHMLPVWHFWWCCGHCRLEWHGPCHVYECHSKRYGSRWWARQVVHRCHRRHVHCSQRRCIGLYRHHTDQSHTVISISLTPSTSAEQQQ